MGGNMRLRNKKTGEIVESWAFISAKYNSLAALNEDWEDYEPSEPFFDEKIRKAIKAWWEIQDNPFKSASVLCINNRKDADGFYNYRIFGYIQSGECKASTDLEFRTKKFYEYNGSKEYTKLELCGEEEE